MLYATIVLALSMSRFIHIPSPSCIIEKIISSVSLAFHGVISRDAVRIILLSSIARHAIQNKPSK